MTCAVHATGADTSTPFFFHAIFLHRISPTDGRISARKFAKCGHSIRFHLFRCVALSPDFFIFSSDHPEIVRSPGNLIQLKMRCVSLCTERPYYPVPHIALVVLVGQPSRGLRQELHDVYVASNNSNESAAPPVLFHFLSFSCSDVLNCFRGHTR